MPCETMILPPLYHSTVGFDRLASMLDRAMTVDVNTNGYPPYNIEKSGDDQYRISIAVAGFSDEELSIEMRDHQLVVSAKKAQADAKTDVTYLHRFGTYNAGRGRMVVPPPTQRGTSLSEALSSSAAAHQGHRLESPDQALQAVSRS